MPPDNKLNVATEVQAETLADLEVLPERGLVASSSVLRPGPRRSNVLSTQVTLWFEPGHRVN